MANFASVDIERLRRAFSLAHNFGQSPDIGDRERKYFRAIAHEIWEAAGGKNSSVADPAGPPLWLVQADRGAGWVTLFEGQEAATARTKYDQIRERINNGSVRLVRPDGHTEFVEHTR